MLAWPCVGENRERKRGAWDVAASGFSSDSVVRGREGKRGGVPTGAGAWRRRRSEYVGPWCGGQ
jgi:hypothetical protein